MSDSNMFHSVRRSLFPGLSYETFCILKDSLALRFKFNNRSLDNIFGYALLVSRLKHLNVEYTVDYNDARPKVITEKSILYPKKDLYVEMKFIDSLSHYQHRSLKRLRRKDVIKKTDSK